MPHVITQSCCSDGSCVYACPVNCIHPVTGRAGLRHRRDALHRSRWPASTAAPACRRARSGAIAPDTRLTDEQLPFVELTRRSIRSAEGKLPPTSKLAPVLEAPVVHPRPSGPLTVAIVGSGPAAMYAADELLTQQGVRVNVFEKLPTPYGLVRAGVAPDHQSTKRVTRLFDRIAARSRVHVLSQRRGRRRTSRTPNCWHTTTPCSTRSVRPTTAGSTSTAWACRARGTATELVAWINGHPDFADLPVDLSHERVVIIGNGNVALDVARILTTDPDALARTDISDHALAALRDSRCSEVVIAARRGPAQSAFTLPELIGLTADARRGARRGRPRAGAARPRDRDRSVDAQQARDPRQAR